MAFPKNISDISTNLISSKLSEVVAAIENKRVKWLSSSLYEGSRRAAFLYGSKKFEIYESFEEVYALYRR